ncbi:MAG: 3-dehydroquinate synthase [Clostridia bacterium]|nr:3-dehydroquinate synthase [Clostridia bacterium]
MIANIGNISYPLYIEKGALDTVGEKIAEKFPSAKVVIITDDKVFSLYGKRVEDSINAQGTEVNSIILEQGEESKSLATLEHVFDKLIEYETSRTDIIAALGGGVIGDLAGFAASCYLRGINYVQIPTTLLAQVDSSIGGKTAVNLKQGKNLAGAFYHPSMVIIDPDASETLDDENFACGMAEVIKYAFIMDKDLYGILNKYNSRSKIQPVLSDVIKKCCEDKLKVVQRDEKDNGLRLTLNFGHTLGHALEKNQELNLSHGHAVAIGMAVFTKNSEKLGQTKQGTYDQVISLLKSFHLPIDMPEADMQKTFEYAKRDKKTFNAKLKLILLEEIGKCFICPIDYEELHKYI